MELNERAGSPSGVAIASINLKCLGMCRVFYHVEDYQSRTNIFNLYSTYSVYFFSLAMLGDSPTAKGRRGNCELNYDFARKSTNHLLTRTV